MHSNEREPEKHPRTIQSALSDWVLPSQYLNIKSESVLVSIRTLLRVQNEGVFLGQTHIFTYPEFQLIYSKVIASIEKQRVVEHPCFMETDTVISPSKKDNDFTSNNPFAKKILAKNGSCKFCNSTHVVKHGFQSGKQRYLCRSCGRKFINPKHHPKMRVPKEVIAFALESYYDGLSLKKVAKFVNKIFKVKVSDVTVWNWIQKYTPLVKEFVQTLKPTTTRTWHIDETHVRVNGEPWWYWEVMDRDTRMILGTHLSRTRTKKDARAVFKDAYETSKEIPETVICDGMPTYYGGLKMALGGRTVYDKINFIQKAGIAKKMPNNNVRIERFHNTLKERTKTMRGFNNPKHLLDGFSLNYNFVREHQTFGNTPAVSAEIELPFNDGWGNLIDWATYHRTLSKST